jgi:signal transduction histidine kinase
VRLRLTLLYGAVFLLCGAVLLGVSYLLVRQTSKGPVYSVKTKGGSVTVRGPHGPVALAFFGLHSPAPPGGDQPANQTLQSGKLILRRTSGSSSTPFGGAPLGATVPAPPISPQTIRTAETQAKQLRALGIQQRHDELRRLLIVLGIALAIMAVISMWLGWFVAGRALRPLQTITRAARAISATNLHRRLSLKGPDDELRELGDTFDDLLERLERSFAAQRQFVANASHELRTPLTLERAIVEVALADPSASTAELRATCERVLAIGDQQERMIDALLTLARSERGLDRRVVFDLRRAVEEVLESRRIALESSHVSLEEHCSSALISGDHELAERLVANLLDNAIHHNAPGGWVRVATGLDAGDAVVSVSNSGPVVPADQLQRLFEPFTRLGAERSARGDGNGLGLSIVAAIANAHEARIEARPRQQGGLEVEVRFAAASRVRPGEMQTPDGRDEERAASGTPGAVPSGAGA